MSVTIGLKESLVSQIRKIMIAEGDALIPDGTGVSSTEVLGYGTSETVQTNARTR